MRKNIIFLALLCAIVVMLSGAVSAADVNSTMNTTTVPAYTNVYVQISNNVSFNYTGNNTYYVQKTGGGLNAVHIANDSSATTNYGGYTVTSNQSGTFYATDTGGRGYQDDVVLMIAVNGTIPDDFAVTIIANGYNWTPTGTQSTAPTLGAISSYGTTLNETFTKSDFLYGAQNWRPSGYSTTYAYPIYLGENMTDSSNMFYLMFIDLHAGLLGSNYNGGDSQFVNNGAVQINYSFTNLQSLAAFNIYAWNANTPWGAGMQWTNSINPAGTGGASGYEVIGTSPAADFTADTTSGNNSLDVQFTDNSSNTPTSWSWDFGDGSTSTEQNPTHTYNEAGNYTVKLTVTNVNGNNTQTKTDYINVLDTIAPTVTANETSGYFNTTQSITLSTDEPATIYYTTNGTDPTTNSTVYTGPFNIANTTTLKFIAVDTAGNQSPVQSETYNIRSDVSVVVTASESNPRVGDNVTYTFKVSNSGPGVAQNVTYVYVIPEGLEYVGATVDQGTVLYNATTRTLTWNLGDVAVGDPYLWLNLHVLSAGTYRLHPTISVSGYDPELNASIGSLIVNAVSSPMNTDNSSGNGMTTVNAATVTKTVNTVPMQSTGVPLAGLVSALLLVGSGLALSRKK